MGYPTMDLLDDFDAEIMGSDQPSSSLKAAMVFLTNFGGELFQCLTTSPADYRKARSLMSEFKKLTVPPVDVAEPIRVAANGVPAYWFVSPGADTDRRILYFHGGGFVMGATSDFAVMLSWLAQVSKCAILSVDYRLAPENPFPAALEDARSAYEYILHNPMFGSGETSRVFVGGDSAGGGLALSLCADLISGGAKLPSAIFALAPWTDIWLSQAEPHVDPGTLSIARANAKAYLGEASAKDPRVSPAYGDPTGFPPLLIQVGDNDPSGMVDSVLFAKKARAKGVEVQLETWRHMPHVWHAFASVLPEANQALHRISSFLKAH